MTSRPAAWSERIAASRAASISARFRQEAFYWVERGEIFLCIDASGLGWPVAPWTDRLVGGSGSSAAC